MIAAVALTNLVLGIAYTGYGMMTAIEMKRDWRTFGFSHFGAAWICMAFTCGPHHLDHGLHVALDGRVGGPPPRPAGSTPPAWPSPASPCWPAPASCPASPSGPM